MIDIETKLKIRKEAILAQLNSGIKSNRNLKQTDVLPEILEHLQPTDFREAANLDENEKVRLKHEVVLTVEEALSGARSANCGLCRNQDFIYSYNGELWQLLEREKLEAFLGQAAEKLGVERITANYHKFRTELLKQFIASAYLPTPEPNSETVLINLQNGTFEINGAEMKLRNFSRDDFLTYQLPFEFDRNATCPTWLKFLNEVLPDQSRQDVLAEYIGYVFARHLKLEKTLILYGTGANGKSVVFDVINALLGAQNVSNYSLESLGNDYHRAMIANKLLNYSSEISNRLQTEKFKQLTSGEPVEARLPYGQPMILTNYARLAFNSNELPREVEHSEAFFRRFLIIPFDVTIPEEKRNPNLAKEIIATELSGVFNWVLEGLKRLLRQNGFSQCGAAREMVNSFRRESDSVAMFLDEEGYKPSQAYTPLKTLYQNYKDYCTDNGYKQVGNNNFRKRLEALNIHVPRYGAGRVAYVQN
jgi:putative DNA primase/helicase